MAASNLTRRIVFASVAIPLALLLVWNGGLPLALFTALVSVLGTRELYDLAERDGIRPARALGLASAALLAPAAFLALADPAVAAGAQHWWPYAAALWVLLLLVWALAARTTADRPLAAAGVTVLGVLYTGALPVFLLDLRSVAGPRSWSAAWVVFYPLVVTWVCDTAAMFSGKAIGGPRLAPVVSPGKTRVGALGGLVGALLVAPAFHLLAPTPFGDVLTLAQLLLMEAVLSVVGQVGDLAESLYKREAGVKDSSSLIPAHGGVLDRFDSLYFVVPVAAVLYRLFGL